MEKNNTIKQASRLTGSLLARKGAAAPSQASLLLNQPVVDRFSSVRSEYNDEKAASDISRGNGLSTKKNISLRQQGASQDKNPACGKQVGGKQERVSGTLSDISKSPNRPVADQCNNHKRIAMTLRMEEENHLKLRIFSAYSRKSCQVILSEALDHYLKQYEDTILSGDIASLQNIENGV